jgi:arylsulfatase A-like enzyme
VPLVIRYPRRVPSNVRVTHTVTLRDLSSTIYDLAGVRVLGRGLGASLAATWAPAGGSPRGSIVMAEVRGAVRADSGQPTRFGPMRSTFDEQLHYIHRGDGEERLYRYRTDAEEADNLLNDPDLAADLQHLRALATAAAPVPN